MRLLQIVILRPVQRPQVTSQTVTWLALQHLVKLDQRLVRRARYQQDSCVRDDDVVVLQLLVAETGDELLCLFDLTVEHQGKKARGENIVQLVITRLGRVQRVPGRLGVAHAQMAIGLAQRLRHTGDLGACVLVFLKDQALFGHIDKAQDLDACVLILLTLVHFSDSLACVTQNCNTCAKKR